MLVIFGADSERHCIFSERVIKMYSDGYCLLYHLTIFFTVYMVKCGVVTTLSYSMIVLYSRDHQGLGVVHEKILPKTSLTSLTR